MHAQRHPSKSKVVNKYIELRHMEFCVLKLMIAGYTIDDISLVHNIKPKTTYTYTNNIMKQLGFNSLKKYIPVARSSGSQSRTRLSGRRKILQQRQPSCFRTPVCIIAVNPSSLLQKNTESIAAIRIFFRHN